MKTCFFIGHREVGEEILPFLMQTVERYILQHGVTKFVVGNYGGFDRMAARTVKLLKQKYPNITLLLLLPYHPSVRPIPTPDGFDGTYYPLGMERVPARFAIVRANRYMVEQSDFLIAFAWHSGNARNLFDYAQKRMEKGMIQAENLASYLNTPQK